MPGAEERRGHGWWPYLVPFFSFLLIVEIARRIDLPELFLPAKVLVPGVAFLYFALRGSYPELRGYRATPGGVAADLGVGVAGAVLWMAPFVLVQAWRPEPGDGFDAEQLGESLVPLALGLRAAGYAGVTPFVEELFIRSWLGRYIEVYDRPGDFRDRPIARYSLRNFAAVVIGFTAGHLTWEWPVALLWVVGTQLWLYRRGHIVSVIIAHAASNASIFACALLASGKLSDPDGTPIDLWFFL